MQPKTLQLKDQDQVGPSGQVFLRILRGPITWQTKLYDIDEGQQELHFTEDEEFKRKCGFYFTKDGAEFKKACIKIIKKNTSDD